MQVEPPGIPPTDREVRVALVSMTSYECFFLTESGALEEATEDLLPGAGSGD